MTEKLKSRKLWMAVTSAILVIANKGLDLGIDETTVTQFVALILGYVFAEAAVDGLKK